MRGCTPVSPGCANCYAEKVAARFCGEGQPYEGLIKRVGKDKRPRWNGTTKVVHEHMADPLRWGRPRMVFVNSMSDLFHETIAAVYGIMALSPSHTFQVLTKRPERAAQFFQWLGCMIGHDGQTGEGHQVPTDPLMGCVMQADRELRNASKYVRKAFITNYQGGLSWPPKNVWLGVSVEDQGSADIRIPRLIKLPAALRFLSIEPLLGPIDLTPLEWRGTNTNRDHWLTELDWIIVGGESGPGARPMQPDWAREIRDRCLGRADMGRPWPLPFFFKQWGAWGPSGDSDELARLGKKASGRLLDGEEYRAFPRGKRR